MTTQPIDTRDLPYWCKVKAEITKEWVTTEEILTYKGMDGMYGRFFTESGDIANATWKHTKEWEYWIFIEKPQH
jgi:hypothetical protein